MCDLSTKAYCVRKERSKYWFMEAILLSMLLKHRFPNGRLLERHLALFCLNSYKSTSSRVVLLSRTLLNQGPHMTVT